MQNKQSSPSYEVLVRKKLLLLLFNVCLFCFVSWFLLVFSVAKISLKKLNKQKTVLITSFTILLTSYISGKKFPNSKNEKNPL